LVPFLHPGGARLVPRAPGWQYLVEQLLLAGGGGGDAQRRAQGATLTLQ